MTYEEAIALLGEDGLRRAREFVASLPPLSQERIEAVAQIIRAADAAEQQPVAHNVA